ncbi:carboxymuconolactone decarboxylase family protein [Variovorax saccharolyticus]|uniref:carboxymuconolactone decarboxylase family protein n=1 Tax=Variovorax saccharolyticus TaxID=3053516 RepID=UPI002576D14C|nr:carboxymuconolactone decarboxylase family protein [Variovorax sp. J22R187]MDM0021801.1 carboxymuconolactone decarboxylase family protein [Variovorax sp. J22R187]
MEKSDLWKKGDAVRAEMLGAAAVERLEDSGIYEDAGMQKISDYVREAVFGMLWTRPGIENKLRALVCVVIDATAKSPVELALHLRMARRLGWSEDELTEILLFMAGYVGIPASREALVVAKRVFDEIRAEATPPPA